MLMSMALETPEQKRRHFDAARVELLSLAKGDELPVYDQLRRILEVAAKTLGVARASVWHLSPDRTTLRCVSLFESEIAAYSEGTRLKVADCPRFFEALSQSGVISAAHASQDPLTSELAAYLEPPGITSLLDAALHVDGELVGVVCLEHTGLPREWTNDEREFVRALSDVITSQMMKRRPTELDVQTPPAIDMRHVSAVRQTAAGIGHDFRNLLTVIQGNAGLLARRPHLTATDRDLLSTIMNAAERGAGLANELVSCGTNDVQPLGVICAADVVEAMLDVLRAAIGDQHELEFSRPQLPAYVLIHSNQLERIILNLVVNARDACAVGGRILVAIRNEDVQYTSFRSRAFVCLEVQDCGSGIDPATLPHIFEPFFTTKSRGQGSGLGLAIVKQTTEVAGGFVTVSSEVGRGSIFRVFLPRVSVASKP